MHSQPQPHPNLGSGDSPKRPLRRAGEGTWNRKRGPAILGPLASGFLNRFPVTVLVSLLWLGLLWLPPLLLAQQRWVKEAEVEGDPVMAGLPYDAIPAITDPVFVSRAEAEAFMSGGEPVVAVYDGKVAKAYPAWLLNGHEIVNDRLGPTPIAATW